MSDGMKWMMAYLINSAWQIPVLAACTAGLVKASARGGAGLHYRLWVGCFALAIVLPALPNVGHGTNSRGHLPAIKNAEAKGNGMALATWESDRIGVYRDAIAAPAETKNVGTWLLCLYGISILVGLARLIRKLAVTHAVVRRAQPICLTPTSAKALLRSAQALGVGRVEVYRSRTLRCPATASWPRAMLLVPENFASVREDEAAAAISHELAHVRRCDFEVNLACEALAIAAFYHPAIHWIQRQIAEAREVVCDEMAAEITTGRTAYAKWLLNLAETVSMQPEARGMLLGVFEQAAVR